MTIWGCYRASELRDSEVLSKIHMTLNRDLSACGAHLLDGHTAAAFFALLQCVAPLSSPSVGYTCVSAVAGRTIIWNPDSSLSVEP